MGTRWKNFVDSIDTNGGHILFMTVVIFVAAILEHHGVKESGEMITFALGVLSRSMGSK